MEVDLASEILTATPSRQASSSALLAACFLICPAVCSRFKLMACANKERLCRIREHRPKKMIAFADLSHKLLLWIDGRINRSSQRALGACQLWQQLGKSHIADDHQVDIALGRFLIAGNGPKYERAQDLLF